MPHGVEGDGEPAAEEEDKVGGQLETVVNGEGQIVPGRRQTVVVILKSKGRYNFYF